MNAKPKRGTVIGNEGRSIAVRYGSGVTDILLIRPCDFHAADRNEGAEVELRYTDYGNRGAWWHAFPLPTPDEARNLPARNELERESGRRGG